MGINRREIRRLLNKWQRILLIRDWVITININEDEAWPNHADTVILPGRREAVITYAAKLDPADWEKYTIHELLHLVLNPLGSLLYEWEGELPEDKHELFGRQFECCEELAIDNLEKALLRLKL